MKQAALRPTLSKSAIRLVRPGAVVTLLVVGMFLASPVAVRAVTKTSNVAPSGPWNTAASWLPSGVPGVGDDVTIASGDTINLDVNTASLASLTVNGTLAFGDNTARTATVTGVVTVAASGTITINNFNDTHTFIIGGDLVNNGVFDMNTGADDLANVTFNGAANQTISGTGATTEFNLITVNKAGAAGTDSLEVTSTNFTPRAVGFLILTNGQFKLSGTFTLTNPLFNVASYTIGLGNAVWLNNPNVTVTAQGGGGIDSFLNGTLRVTSGTYNIGTSDTEGFEYNTGATFQVEGGTVNFASRFRGVTTAQTLTFIMSGGTVNVCTVSNTSSRPSLAIEAVGSSFTMSGGTIIFPQANVGNGTTNGGDYQNVAGTVNITGGTVQFGNANTVAATDNFNLGNAGTNVTPSISIVDTGSGVPTLTLVRPVTVLGNVTIGTGTSLLANSQAISMTGNAAPGTSPGSWTNSGTFTPGTQTTTFNGTAAQAIGGSASTAFSGLTIANTGAGTTTLNTNGSASGVLTLTSDLMIATGIVFTQSGTSAAAALGDALGIVRRTDVNGTAKSFGNVNVMIANGGTATQVDVNLAKGAPGGFAGAVLRGYSIIAGTGTVSGATVRLRYLDPGELNGNTEGSLTLWRATGSPSAIWQNQGFTTRNAANNFVELTGVGGFSEWTLADGSAPNVPTAVKLTSFTAMQNNGEVMLQWRTGYEAHNLGYVVYREQNGRRVAITPSLVAGSALLAGRQTNLSSGLSYTWYDQIGQKSGVRSQESEVKGPVSAIRGQKSGANQQSAISNPQSPVTYWLEDVDLNGTRTLHGPIAPSQVYALPPKGGKLLRADLISEMSLKAIADMRSGSSIRTPVTGVEFSSWPAAFTQQRAQQLAAERMAMPQTGKGGKAKVVDPDGGAKQRQIESQPGIKIAVNQEGWYRITQPELVAAGYDPNTNAPQLQLYSNGRAVPIKQSGDQVHLTSSDYIEFYGQGLESPTDTAKTYYLVVDANQFGTRIGDLIYRDPQPLPPPSGASSFDYTVERRERMIYFSSLLNGDTENFFGQIVSTTPTVETIPISNLAPTTEGTLEVVLQGVTGQAHLVQVSFNGTDLGTMSFTDTEHPTGAFSVPAAALQSSDNALQLTSLGGAADVSLVDTVRLTYGHSYAADSNALAISIDSQETKRIAGFTSNNIRIVDITDPARALELTQTAEVNTEADGTYSVDLQVQDANLRHPHSLFVFADNAATPVAAVKHNQPSTWWSQTSGADYLMITTRELMASVEPLAQLRRNQGQVVNVIDVEDVYDEFSFGQHAPQAIHDLLQTAENSWTRQPHYLLLAGDASYDPKNYFGQGANDLVPTKLLDTALMEAASDDWLADFNGDGLADLAVGRLPGRTAAELNLMIGKITAYENAAPDPARGALLVADTSFEAPSSAVGSLLPAGMPVTTVNRGSTDDATARAQILAGLNQGPRVANYFGHGSNGVWTGASLLSSDDAPGLTNTSRLSVYTMMTCFNGYFQDAWNDSLSEALLKSQGGAVAVWASTTLTDPSGQNVIDLEFYRQLFGPQPATLGDASRAAKATTGDADVRRTWTLFGDPAMRLR